MEARDRTPTELLQPGNWPQVKTYDLEIDLLTSKLTSWPLSARYGGWAQGKNQQSAAKTSPRIMVFIAGGATYSEMRAGYEVTNDKKNWEIVMGGLSSFLLLLLFIYMIIFVGGTHIMTPEEFLDYVKDVAGSGDDEE